ncbi:hypothetical protein E2C01_080856 [Portunus trituberculatus]|uniref:Uncharacterized protein n=1 Tax=Portunus trituberculatus TaxID=210409 RepID=A0A5B7J0Q0_PORTR|nr:hypothetical protein [Portunus trituberculatus]
MTKATLGGGLGSEPSLVNGSSRCCWSSHAVQEPGRPARSPHHTREHAALPRKVQRNAIGKFHEIEASRFMQGTLFLKQCSDSAYSHH